MEPPAYCNEDAFEEVKENFPVANSGGEPLVTLSTKNNKIYKPTTFEELYESFRKPLIDMFQNLSCQGKKIFFNPFEHDEQSKIIETELSHIAETQNAQQLLLTLSNMLCLYNTRITKPVKYLLCFYKVHKLLIH